MSKIEGGAEVDISFVILTWNSIRYIDDCIHSFSDAMRKEGLSAQFLIVDNGSRDGTIERLEKHTSPSLPSGCRLKVFKLDKNMGTTASRNMALRDATGETIVICDSDTECEEGSWRNAIKYIHSNEAVGILAPLLCLEDGAIQRSVKRFPTAVDKMVRVINIGLRSKGVSSDMYEDFPWNETRPVDTAISACWVFRRDLLESVGYLDERIFYSPEDVDYCLRTWKAGKEVIFYPDIRITHHTQQISHKKPFSKLAFSHLMGLIYYFMKHRYLLSRKSVCGTHLRGDIPCRQDRSRSMRIFWVHHAFPPSIGGVQNYGFNTVMNLQAGCAVVLSNANTDPRCTDIDATLASRKQKIYRKAVFADNLGVLSLTKTPGKLYRFCATIKEISKGEGIDLIIFGACEFYYLYAILLLKRILRVPLALVSHGEDIPTEKFKSNRLKRWLLNRVGVLICNSLFTRNRMNAFLGRDTGAIVAYPGVEDKFFSKVDVGPLRRELGAIGKRLLFTVGRLDERKGHDTVIRALPTILKKHPEILYLVGGDGSHREELMRLAQEQGVSAYVRFIGSIADHRILEFFQVGDIFVMPNRTLEDGDSEGFGIVFLEAGACSKPVIGGRAGGVPEAAEDGVTGLLVDGFDIDDFVDKVCFLLDHPEEAKRMGVAGRVRAEASFRWVDLVAKLEKELKLSGSKAKKPSHDRSQKSRDGRGK